MLPCTLWLQVPVTVALGAALAAPRGRAALARHLQAALAAQFAVHALWCTVTQALLLDAEVMAPRRVVVFQPLRLAVMTAFFTLLLWACCPLRARAALPLLAARAALASAAAAAPQRFACLWPICMQRAAGAAVQVAACAAAAALTVARERSLARLYAQHVARAAAEAADGGAGSGVKKAKSA
jgi:hypothetical protein